MGESEDVSQYSLCKLCDAVNANYLKHYYFDCRKVVGLITDSVTEICKYLLTGGKLDKRLLQFSCFGDS